MKKKILLISVVSALIVGVTATLSIINVVPERGVKTSALSAAPAGGDEYDYWCNSWSKPGHLYVHYNRGDKNDYDQFCFWCWDDKTDTDGTLWAYSGKTDVSSTLELVPMSTHWMYNSDIGVDGGTTIYKDNFGVIADVDLTKTLYGGKVQKGKQKEEASYDKCDDLGFLFPKISSMDGSSHWTSDGGKDNDVEEWKYDENWRNIDNEFGKGTACHIFFASGQLTNYSFYAGSGIPEVKVNPMDADKTGGYSSKVDNITDSYGVSSTSEAFKKLGVGYQIFVASFRDSDGDGYGDIRGIIDSLDYLDDLGVDVLWLTPIQKSDSYHGYDISDYYAVDPKFGTVEDYRELLYKAHQKGMKVLMDLVLNHTSKSNVWFTKSQWGVNSGAPGAEKDDTGINWRNVYTWKYKTDKVLQAKRTADGKGILEPVQYEQITVEQAARDPYGPSWYKDGEGDYYYYGKFGSSMPEINYENKDTRKLVTDMAKYWLSFGLDGFRLDAVKHIYMKDEVTASNGDIIVTDVGSKEAYDEEKGQRITQPYDYSSNQTKNVAFWKQFSNELKAIYPNCFLVGENFDGYGHRTAAYYQGLDSQFDFANYYHVAQWLTARGNEADGGASTYAAKEVGETFDSFRADTTEVYEGDTPKQYPGGKRGDFIDGAFTSNHDVMRAINQADGTKLSATATEANQKIDGTPDQIRKAKVHGAVTMLHPGVSWIYYGDELGMSSNTDTHIAKYGNENSMDIWYRQPMMWNDSSVRPNYRAGQYKFEYDSYNQKLASQGKGITYKNGAVSSTNEMYAYYKALCALKALFPDNAQENYEGSTNILIMNVWGENGKPLKIYINTGFDGNEYLMNPGDGFQDAPVAQIGCSGMGKGSNIGSTPAAIVAFQGK